MANEDEAKRAIAELNGYTLNGNRLNVEVGFSMQLLSLQIIHSWFFFSKLNAGKFSQGYLK